MAPFDGVVTARNVDVGSLVRADGTNSPALFTVADIHQMRIYVPVPETYAADLKDGMKATLELPEYPDRKFDATIATTSHAIDPKSRTLLVELLADNKDGFSPRARSRASVFEIPPDPNTFTIPASAMLYRDTEPQVATVGLDNRIALKRRAYRARPWNGGRNHWRRSARTSASSPIRPIRSATARRSGSWKRLGRRRKAPPGQQARGGPNDHPKSAEEMAQNRAGSRRMKWRPWLAAPIALALGGCDFAPRYAPPSVAVPSKFKDETAGGGTLPVKESGGSPSTIERSNELQAQVDAANPTLAAAVAANDEAVARANAALSSAYPQIDAVPHFLANKQSANRPLRSANQPTYYGDNLIGAQTAYEIDIWGRVRDIVERRRTRPPKRAPMRSPTRDSNCTPNSRATTSICAASTIRPSFFPIRSPSIARP